MSFRFSILILCLFATVLRAEPPKLLQFFKPSPKGHEVPSTVPPPVPAGRPGMRPLFDPPPLGPVLSGEEALKVQAMIDLAEVQQLLKEIAVTTVEAQRRVAVARVNQFLEKMLDKNLSRSEMQVVLGILEAATVEQIRDGSNQGPLAFLAKTIYAKLDSRVGGTPEARAVKILAKQVVDLMTLKPQERTKFRDSIGRFKHAFVALGDDKIDGKGILLLLAASLNGGKNILEMVFQRVKDVFNPMKAEASLKALGVLLNWGLNPDPISKDILRDFLDQEMDKQRLVANRDGSVNWKATLEGMAKTAPEDAKNLGNVLVGTRVMNKKDVDNVLKAVDFAGEAAKQMKDFEKLYAVDPNAALNQFPKQFQSFVQQRAILGQIDPEEAIRLNRIAGSIAVAQEADAFARQLRDTLNTPAGQWPAEWTQNSQIQRLPPVLDEIEVNAPPLLSEQPGNTIRR